MHLLSLSRLASVVAAAGLAASLTVPAAAQPAEQRTAAVIQPAPPGRLEIFSWWTTGGEAAGLNALFDIYRAQNPGVEIVNATVAGDDG